MKILPAIISIIMLLALCAANLFADGPYDQDYVPRVGATPAPPGSGGSVKRGEEWGSNHRQQLHRHASRHRTNGLRRKRFALGTTSIAFR